MQPSDSPRRIGIIGGGLIVSLFPAKSDLFGAYGSGRIVNAETLREILLEPFVNEGVAHTISFSLGLVRSGAADCSGVDLLRNAAIALKRAKLDGPGNDACYTAEVGVLTRQRVHMLHDLRAAVLRWTRARNQRVWLRQLSPEVGPEADGAMLTTIARWNGTSFPSTATLAWRWATGRSDVPRLPVPAEWSRQEQAEVTYCAELAAITYEAMGVLGTGRPTNWYDPGRFWSGDTLPLNDGWSLGNEVEVLIDEADRRG